jgi:uncharacterized protein DUF1843
MPTKSPQSTKKSASSSKKSSGKSAAAAIRSGAIPPYGVPIRDAISRGNAGEMQGLATATRQYLKNVQSALAKLEAAMGKRWTSEENVKSVTQTQTTFPTPKEGLMPARKSPKKAAKVSKTTAKTSSKPAKLNVPIVALYAVPIYSAIKRGDAAEMKKLAAQARKHISDVSTALGDLEKRIGKK